MFLGGLHPGRVQRTTLLALGTLLAGALLAVLAATGDQTQAARIKPIKKPAWVPRTLVTEYYPARESWFSGKRVKTPGLNGRMSKVDWLYSAVGVSMEGDGLGTDGKRYHLNNPGRGGWVGRDGKRADWRSSDKDRTPFWRVFGFWQNSKKAVTFPLEDGSWYHGKGKKWIKPKGATFGRGASLPLRYYRSVATDLALIPRGSLVWIGRYRKFNGDGWFRADDTGGAINGRHIDVYRKPPRELGTAGTYKDQRIFVVPKAKIVSYLKRERKSDSDGIPLPPAELR
jgi:3D (Asp-Asp-Asp) domain-containing protein